MKERFSTSRISEGFYQEEWETVFKKAYEKSQAINSANEINPEEFIDLYGEETVRNDIKYVERMRKEFSDLNKDSEEKKAKMIADTLEAIIFEQGE